MDEVGQDARVRTGHTDAPHASRQLCVRPPRARVSNVRQPERPRARTTSQSRHGGAEVEKDAAEAGGRKQEWVLRHGGSAVPSVSEGSDEGRTGPGKQQAGEGPAQTEFPPVPALGSPSLGLCKHRHLLSCQPQSLEVTASPPSCDTGSASGRPAGPYSGPNQASAGCRGGGRGGEATGPRNSCVRLAARGSRPLIGGGARRRGAGSCLFLQPLLSVFCRVGCGPSASRQDAHPIPDPAEAKRVRRSGIGSPAAPPPTAARPGAQSEWPGFPGAGVGRPRTVRSPSGRRTPGEGRFAGAPATGEARVPAPRGPSGEEPSRALAGKVL